MCLQNLSRLDYSEQGRNTFESYLKCKHDQFFSDLQSGHKKMWGYYENGEILGVIATRDISHISLMFVDKNHHKKGIAKQMFHVVLEALKKHPGITEITVNSSPYAVPVYEHLGFTKTDVQQERDGIIFIPMQRPL